MLTVDLENYVTTEQRKKFNEKMKELDWKKLVELTTTWTAPFKEDVARSSALRITKSDVAEAAKEGKISKYHAAVQFGEESPDTFKSVQGN